MTRQSALVLLSIILLVATSVTVGVIVILRHASLQTADTNVEVLHPVTSTSSSMPASPQAEAPSLPTPLPSPVPIPTPNPVPTPTEISRGSTSQQQVIFTFDAGAGTQSLAAILSSLHAHHLQATFFVTGRWAHDNPAAVSQIAAAGHEIFNHTYSHPDLTTVSDTVIVNELQQANVTISVLTGKTTKPYFRPPYGARNTHVLDIAWGQGYRSVYWTIDALDWKPGMTADQVRTRVLEGVAPGTIYLMHIGDDITGQVLDGLLSTIEDRGYRVVPLTQGL